MSVDSVSEISVSDPASSEESENREPKLLPAVSDKKSGNSNPRFFNGEEFVQCTSQEERDLIQNALDRGLFQFILQGSEVYLEGLGILSPHVEKKNIQQRLPDERTIFFQRRECLTVQFEKCLDISLLPNREQRFIVDHGRLSERIYAELPLSFQWKWTEAQTRRLLRCLIKNIRDEVLRDGVSNRLPSLGQFYSFHMKSGEQPSSWYEGAEILLDPELNRPLRVLSSKIATPPLYENSWEPCIAAFGAPQAQRKLHLRQSLLDLGYELDLEALPTPLPEEIRIGIFEQSSHSREKELLYITDGFRHFTGSAESEGLELSFSLRIDKRKMSSFGDSPEETPDWPINLFTLAWILLQGSPKKTLRPGAGITLDSNICHWPGSRLRAILVTESGLFSDLQFTEEAEYRVMHLLGISLEEAQLAESFGPHYLLTLLRLQKLNSVTDPLRNPIPTPAMLIPSI